jgi:hypothetical protein
LQHHDYLLEVGLRIDESSSEGRMRLIFVVMLFFSVSAFAKDDCADQAKKISCFLKDLQDLDSTRNLAMLKEMAIHKDGKKPLIPLLRKQKKSNRK